MCEMYIFIDFETDIYAFDLQEKAEKKSCIG